MPEQKWEMVVVPLRRISRNDDNPRTTYDEAALERMAASVRKDGIRTPLHVFKAGEKFVLLAGERRYAAARLAKLDEVPVIIKPKPTTRSEMIIEMLDDNDDREDLSPVDRATSYQTLMKENRWTDLELARAVGEPVAFVRQHLRILDLHESVQSQVGAGRVPLSLVSKLVDLEPKQQREAATQLTSGEVGVTELARSLAAAKGDARALSGGPKKPAFTTNVTYPCAGGVTVSVRSLSKRLTPAQIKEALRAAISQVG